MTTMRAKVRVSEVKVSGDCELLTFNAVAKSTSYPEDGSDEDNSYARWSPSREIKLTVANPALHGKLAIDEKFYVDFTPAN